MNQQWTRDFIIKDLEVDEDIHTDIEDEDEDEKQDSNDDPKNQDYNADALELLLKKPRILGIDDERIFLLEITIHCCDVANPCKPLFLAKQWANRFLLEAFSQGDAERNIGLPVSAGMDRFTTKLPTSQIGFIAFIVKRLFQLYSQIIDKSSLCVDTMLENERYWIQEKNKLTIANKKPASKSDLETITE